MPACHAGGHGFESRTHRKASETNGCLRVTKPTKSMICGLYFFLFSAILKTNKCPVQTKLRYQIVTEKPGFRNCNDFPCKSLICRPLSLKCPLVNQLLIGAGAQDTTGTGSCPHRNTWTRARTRRRSGIAESGERAEAGHSHFGLYP